MVPLDRALVGSYKLSIVGLTVSLTTLSAAVWPQFATQVFGGSAGRLRYTAKLCK